MISDQRLEELMDLWEDLLERKEPPSVEAFVSQHCKDASPKVVAQFRLQAQALQKMNARIQAADAEAGDSAYDTSAPPLTKRVIRLEPGLEPIPGYTLVARLGRGGFGEVWKATGPGGFHVALKFVRLQRKAGETERRALDVIKEVRHANLLTTFAVWDRTSYLIIAMELADRTLLDRLRECQRAGQTGIPEKELIEYMLEAAKGVDYLNEAHHASGNDIPVGIQHRDIKPQNLLMCGGSVKVADFGLARYLTHTVTSHTGSMTLAYAAPEFFSGQTSNFSDQYCLAVTYCQLRGGRLPFTGNEAEVIQGHLVRDPDLTMLEFEERPIIARALAKNPRERWLSCRTFVEALQRVQAGEHVNRVMRLPFQQKVSIIYHRNRSRVRIGSSVLALSLLATILSYLWVARSNSFPQHPESAATNDNVVITPANVERGASPEPSDTPAIHTFLTEMEEFYVLAGPWGLGKGKLKEFDTELIVVGGVVSVHGLGMHPNMAVRYRLSPDAGKFAGDVAINDTSRGAHSPVSFLVHGDGELLWGSRPLRSPGEKQSFEVSVTGVRVLELVTVCPGDKS